MAFPSLTYIFGEANMLNQPWAHVGDQTYREDLDEVFTLTALPASELSNWVTCGGAGSVSSVFGRSGAVVAEDGDYDFAQISGLLPQSQLATPTPDWLNVKQFGAKGDTQFVTDAATTGSNVVSSATANFKSTDVGKLCWVVQDSSGLLIVGQARLPALSVQRKSLSRALSTRDTASCVLFGERTIPPHSSQRTMLPRLRLRTDQGSELSMRLLAATFSKADPSTTWATAEPERRIHPVTIFGETEYATPVSIRRRISTSRARRATAEC
jgi:hypothetical protein